jgi:hypothetical protein
MKNLFLIGSVAFLFAGCAASNGGGYVVGNSAIPPGKAQKMVKNDGSCSCGPKQEAVVESKSCACGDKKGKDSACTKCGTDECACNH